LTSHVCRDNCTPINADYANLTFILPLPCFLKFADTQSTAMPLFQFTNGIYDTDRCKFYPCKDSKGRSAWEALIADGVHRKADCINSFDVECFTTDGVPHPYMDIPTPTLDRIVGHQVPEEDRAQVLPWIYCHLGRLMFPPNMHDNWKSLLFIHGAAATGKSTLVDMFVDMFGGNNVAFVPSGADGASVDALGKSLWVCSDARDDFAFQRYWESPGLVCSNTLPRLLWSPDFKLAVTPICFNNSVPVGEQDSGLADLLVKEMGCIIPKLCSAYVTLAVHSPSRAPAEPGLVRTWRNQITREAMSMAK